MSKNLPVTHRIESFEINHHGEMELKTRDRVGAVVTAHNCTVKGLTKTIRMNGSGVTIRIKP